MRLYLMLVGGLALLAGEASADASADSSTDAWSRAASDWFRSVDRSETQLRVAAARSSVEPADRDAAIAQIRAGTVSLRILLHEMIDSRSMVAGPLIDPRPPKHGAWGKRLLGTLSLVALSSGVTNMVLGWRGASPVIRNRLGIVSGASGTLFGMLRPRPPTPTADGPDEQTRTVFREMLLHDTLDETWRQLHDLAGDLTDIHDAPVEDERALIAVVHHYSGTLERISTVLDVQVPHAVAVARASGGYACFSDSASARLTQFADHLDWLGADWRGWRWLVGRSQRDALGFLALVEKP